MRPADRMLCAALVISILLGFGCGCGSCGMGVGLAIGWMPGAERAMTQADAQSLRSMARVYQAAGAVMLLAALPQIAAIAALAGGWPRRRAVVFLGALGAALTCFPVGVFALIAAARIPPPAACAAPPPPG